MRRIGVTLKLSSFIFFLFCLFLTTSCTSSSSSDDSSDVPDAGDACSLIGLNSRVINGSTCDGSSRAAIVRFLSFDTQGEFLGFCSGTLITPDTVLTATHCFSGREAAVVVLAGNGTNVETVNAVQILIAPGYRVGGPETGRRLFNDAAVLKLESAMSPRPLPVLLSRSPVQNESGYVYGYGTTRVGASPDSLSADALQGGSMTIREVTENHIFVRFDGSGVNVCTGDSGGPLMVLQGSELAIAGITSQGSNTTCQAGDVTTFTNLQSDSLIQWLSEVAPQSAIR